MWGASYVQMSKEIRIDHHPWFIERLLSGLSIWAEGVAGDFALKVNAINVSPS